MFSYLRKIFVYTLLVIFGSVISLTAGYFTAEIFFTTIYPQPVLEKVEPPQEEKVIHNPDVLSIDSEDVVLKGDVALVTFDTPMNPDLTFFDITAPGEGTWISDKEYQFTFGDLVPDKIYEIGVRKDSQSIDGGVLKEGVFKKVQTGSKLTYRIYVDMNNQGIKNPIKVVFNQSVDHVSAQNAFKISPEVKGSFVWKGQTLSFIPTNLQYQKKYIASLSGLVKSDTGQTVNAGTSITFQTETEVFKLNVPYFHQQYLNSCEAAALRMALAYYKITTDDMTIVNKFGYNPRHKATSTNTWDDPREMFVGFIDQSGADSGYGVYGRPVEKAAKAFGRDAQFQNVVTPVYIAEQIKAGHPVIFWGFTSTTQTPYTWNVPKGGTVTAFKGEHARLIVGLKGSVSNPIGFYVHDPINGNQYQYWDSEKLMRQALYLPGVTDQIVVVR